MSELPGLVRDLALICIYGGLITILFKWLKQPLVLGYILTGIIIGPYIDIMPSVTDNENITTLADIGVIFLLFGLGLEFSFNKIVNVGKAALITANANILFMLFLGYQVGLLLGWTTTDSLFLGGMISMSSTTIIIKAFEELNMKKQPFTDLVFGILVVEDMMGILLLVLLPTIAIGKTFNGFELIASGGKLLFFLVLWFVTGIYLIPTFLKKVAKLLNDEMLLLVSIGLCLGMVLVAVSFGFSSALGAFIMGSILADSDLTERIEKNLKSVKNFFGVVFFVSVGMMVNPIMFITYAKPILAITILVVLGKITFTVFGILISGKRLETAVYCGFSLAQVGEFAFIIATLGMNLKVVSPQIYPIIVAVSVLTTFTTPLMIKFAHPFYVFLYAHLPDKYKKFIDKHTSDKPATNAEESLWKELFVNYFIKLSVSSIILVAIMHINFIMVQNLLLRYLPEKYSAFISTILTLAMMAPFLKNLLSPREKVKKIYNILWQRGIKNRIPIFCMIAFRLVVAAMFIMVVLNHFLTKNIYITYLIVLALIGALYKSKWIILPYKKIEAQFLYNLNLKKKEEAPSEASATISAPAGPIESTIVPAKNKAENK